MKKKKEKQKPETKCVIFRRNTCFEKNISFKNEKVDPEEEARLGLNSILHPRGGIWDRIRRKYQFLVCIREELEENLREIIDMSPHTIRNRS